MRTYQVEQSATGVLLWEGEAQDEEHARDLYAQAAGYQSFATIDEELGVSSSGGDTIIVTAVG